MRPEEKNSFFARAIQASYRVIDTFLDLAASLGFSDLIELVKSPPRTCTLATTASPDLSSNLATSPSPQVSPVSRKRKAASPILHDAPKKCVPEPSPPPTPSDPPLPTDQSSCEVQPDFRSEAARLASFAQWTVTFVQPADLAKAGFYSLNGQDMCRCPFCPAVLGDWEEGDHPMTEHEKFSPNCPFVNGGDVGNVPLESGNLVSEDHLETSLDVSSDLRICTECNKRVDRNHFARHLMSHEGKTFVCDKCGKDLKRRDNLARHRKENCPR